ncbi:MAG: type II secretion system secretin GspD [Thermodesulfobacteriota bacterium]
MLIIFLLAACADKKKFDPRLDLAEINKNIVKPPTSSTLLEEKEKDGKGPARPRSKKITVKGQGGNPNLAILTGAKKFAPGTWQESEVERMREAVGQEPAVTGEPGEAPQGPAAGLQLNFDNADIYEVIQVIGTALKLNYLIDPQVKGVVNIRSGQPVPAEQLYGVFEKILHMNGLDIRSEGDHSYIYVSKKPFSRKVNGPGQVTDLSPSSRLIIQVMPVQHLPSAQALKLVEQYLSEQGSVVDLPAQNTLLISDYEGKIIDVLTILARLDISPLADQNVRLVRVENAPIHDLREELEEIMAAFKVNNGNFQTLSIIPLERLSSLLLVSKSEFLVTNGESWIRELDVIQGQDRDNIYIYNARNTVASELSELVNSLITDEKPLSKKTTKVKTKRASPVTGQPSPVTSTRQTTIKGKRTAQSSLRFAGSPILFADDTRNVILIRALPPDYARIVKLLERLDTLPRQVLVDVLVAEVFLKDELSLGVEWALMNNHLGWVGEDRFSFDVGSSTDLNALAAGTGGLMNAVTAGIGIRFNSGDTSRDFLRALAGETDLSILSSPQVLVLNNETATVNVGQQIPIVTSITENTSGANQVDKTVQYKDTGVILEVTPQINYDGIILLEVKQTVSTALDVPERGVQSQPIKTRELQTKLAVKDGQSIMIGGLIGTDENVNNSGIPLLKDIPWLGYLFKYESREKQKTELIIMLTTYVIESEGVLAQYVREFGAKTAELRKQLHSEVEDIRLRSE